MAKKVTGSVKLQIAAGKATPAPPVGPALGQAQINIMEFCKQFNARTGAKELEGLIIPVVITVYSDRSFTFITKTPPASILLKRAAGIAKGFGSAEQGQSRQGHFEAGRRYRQAKDARSECGFARGGGQQRARHGALDGNRCGGIATGDSLPAADWGLVRSSRPKVENGFVVANTTASRTALSGGRRRNNEKSRKKHHEGAGCGWRKTIPAAGGGSASAESQIRQV